MSRAPVAVDPLPSSTRIAALSLDVGDLARSVDFYTDVIGLTTITTQGRWTSLGVDGTALINLTEVPGAPPAPVGATGLYHLAILLTSRVELGRSLARLVERGYPLGGASDHLVSEALYLADPDGNGIEIYRDRPRSDWVMVGGNPKVDTLPLDLRALLDDARKATRPWDGLAAGTTLGHIHLQVDDLATARAFYVDVIGFEVTMDLSRMGALFVSAGGYHHHVGLNTWRSRGGPRRPEGTAGLVSFEVEVGDADVLAAVAARLEAAGVQMDGGDGYLSVEDPAGNTVVLSAGGTSVSTATLGGTT